MSDELSKYLIYIKQLGQAALNYHILPKIRH